MSYDNKLRGFGDGSFSPKVKSINKWRKRTVPNSPNVKIRQIFMINLY